MSRYQTGSSTYLHIDHGGQIVCSFNLSIANICGNIQIGDEALAGWDEIDITHRLPPDNTNDRTILFKGYYLSIYN